MLIKSGVGMLLVLFNSQLAFSETDFENVEKAYWKESTAITCEASPADYTGFYRCSVFPASPYTYENNSSLMILKCGESTHPLNKGIACNTVASQSPSGLKWDLHLDNAAQLTLTGHGLTIKTQKPGNIAELYPQIQVRRAAVSNGSLTLLGTLYSSNAGFYTSYGNFSCN